MENASRALIMAGSVLLALLIIGLLVFMFNSISGLKQQEANSEQVLKLAEYNKRILTYNRELYGPELVSLANLIEDYNYRQPELQGYKDIEFRINIDDLNEPTYFNSSRYRGNNAVKNIIEDYKKMEQDLASYKQNEQYSGINIGKSAMDWNGMTLEQRNAYMQRFEDRLQTEIREYMDEKADAYNSVRATSNNFKNRRFKPEVFDDSTGRVTKIVFTINPI